MHRKNLSYNTSLEKQMFATVKTALTAANEKWEDRYMYSLILSNDLVNESDVEIVNRIETLSMHLTSCMSSLPKARTVIMLVSIIDSRKTEQWWLFCGYIPAHPFPQDTIPWRSHFVPDLQTNGPPLSPCSREKWKTFLKLSSKILHSQFVGSFFW